MTAIRARCLRTLGTALLAACVGTPAVHGVAGTSPAPNEPWTPPVHRERAPDAAAAATPPAIPADLAERVHGLTLGDVVDLALRNNSVTRISWANARAAAAAYGSAQGAYFPTLDLGASTNALKTPAIGGRSAVQQVTYGPTATLTFLVFDLGGRSGSVTAAREGLIAADWTHNAAIQDVVLAVQHAYFNYVANRALVEAQRLTLREAQANLDVTEERHRQGLATIADVLQARTQLSQAQLALETTEGAIQITRGALANSMGFPANLPYDIAAFPPLQVGAVTDSVDALITRALQARPDLAAARAQAAAAAANVSVARSARLPSLELGGTGGRTYLNALPNGGNNYSVTLGLKVPLFSGFSRLYDQRAAEARAELAAASAEQLRQLVALQVFSAYYTLQTAARQVRTADDLLASATQSDEVALGRYKAGVGTILDLLTAQSALADARAQWIETRWMWRTALAQLAHDIGVLDAHGDSPLRITADSSALR